MTSFLDDGSNIKETKNKGLFSVKSLRQNTIAFLKITDKLYIVAHGNTSVIGTVAL